MNGQNWSWKGRSMAALIAALAAAVLGVGASIASAGNGDQRDSPDEPIVGFWQVTFTDQAGNVMSHVWDAWHSDRTEVQNDSDNVLAGNVCQGAWVPLGRRTYGLTHPAFIFADPTLGGTEDNEGQFAGVSCVILERVRVDKSSNSYAGPGAIKYVAGVDPFDPAATLLGPPRISPSPANGSLSTSANCRLLIDCERRPGQPPGRALSFMCSLRLRQSGECASRVSLLSWLWSLYATPCALHRASREIHIILRTRVSFALLEENCHDLVWPSGSANFNQQPKPITSLCIARIFADEPVAIGEVPGPVILPNRRFAFGKLFEKLTQLFMPWRTSESVTRRWATSGLSKMASGA